MLRFSLLLAALLLASGCTGVGLSPQAGEPCFDQGHCAGEAGFLRACIDHYCQPVGCLSSADCQLGFVCELENDLYGCLPGCLGDYDCPAGSNCEQGQCVDYGCRTTVLDCGFGEVCNTDSHECEPAQGPYCGACAMDDNVWDLNESKTSCDDTITGHPVCGEQGFCWDSEGTGNPICYVHCETTSSCPAGYQCVFMNRLLETNCEEQYLSLGSVCVADCP